MLTVRLTLALSMAAFALPAPAGAALKIADVGVLNPVLAAGSMSKVKVLVRNTGRKAVRGGVVRFKLADRGGKALTGAAKVGRVKARRSKTLTGSVVIPKALRPGGHAIVACLKQACAAQGEPIGVEAPPPADSLGPLGVTPRIAEGGIPRTGVISKNGGSLYAIGPDNRFYLLLVPPGALANDEQISIKPLAAVEGMPFAGGLLAGAQLEPAGLEFARPAALIISGEGITPAADQAAFAYDGNGRDFRLNAWFVTPPGFADGQYDPSKSLVIPVEHFSGVGVAPATSLEVARQLRYDAAAARNRLSQSIGKATLQERNRQQQNPDSAPGDLSELNQVTLGSFLEQVILPEAAAASFSDAMYEAALRDLASWERQRQLITQGEEVSVVYEALLARIHRLLKIAWEKLVERAEKRCYAGDFSIMARIIPLERQRQLVYDIRPNEFSEGLKRCWKFELRVTSTLVHKGSSAAFNASVDETYELKGTIPLGIDGEGLDILAAEIVGTGPFTYSIVRHTGSSTVDFGITSGTCQSTSTGRTTPGQITVQQGNLGYVIKDGGVGRAVPPFLTLDAGDPQEEINTKCQGQAGGQPSNTDETTHERTWLRYFSSVHGNDRANADQSSQQQGQPDPGPWRIAFKQEQWPMLGRLEVSKSDAMAGFSLTELWELVHTPPKAPRTGS